MRFVYGRQKTFNMKLCFKPSGPVVQPGMNDDRVVVGVYAAFACPAERGGGRGFKSRPVHHFWFKRHRERTQVDLVDSENWDSGQIGSLQLFLVYMVVDVHSFGSGVASELLNEFSFHSVSP